MISASLHFGSIQRCRGRGSPQPGGGSDLRTLGRNIFILGKIAFRGLFQVIIYRAETGIGQHLGDLFHRQSLNDGDLNLALAMNGAGKQLIADVLNAPFAGGELISSGLEMIVHFIHPRIEAEILVVFDQAGPIQLPGDGSGAACPSATVISLS